MAAPHLPQYLTGIGHGAAILCDHHARRCFLAGALVKFDLPVLHDAGGAVKGEGKFLIRGQRKGHRVGAHHGLHAPGRCHGRPGIGTGDADHPLFGCHVRPVSRDPVVGGIADGAARHAHLFGLFDQALHHAIAGHHAHAVVRVHDQRGGRLLQDLQLCFRQQRAIIYAVQIDGLEPVAAVAFDAPAVRFQQHVCADGSIRFRYAVRFKNINHKSIHHVPGDARSVICHHTLLFRIFDPIVFSRSSGIYCFLCIFFATVFLAVAFFSVIFFASIFFFTAAFFAGVFFTL